LLDVDLLSKKSRTLAHSFGSVRRLRRVGHDGDLVVIALRNSSGEVMVVMVRVPSPTP